MPYVSCYLDGSGKVCKLEVDGRVVDWPGSCGCIRPRNLRQRIRFWQRLGVDFSDPGLRFRFVRSSQEKRKDKEEYFSIWKELP